MSASAPKIGGIEVLQRKGCQRYYIVQMIPFSSTHVKCSWTIYTEAFPKHTRLGQHQSWKNPAQVLKVGNVWRSFKRIPNRFTTSLLPDSIDRNFAFQKFYCSLKNSIHSTYEDIKQDFITNRFHLKVYVRIFKKNFEMLEVHL